MYYIKNLNIQRMGYSPLFRSIGFWGSFYVIYNYAKLNP